MFSRCANPDCALTFDYRQGRFFRFHKNVAAGEIGHSVQHFWLCGQCCQKFTLEYKHSEGAVINRADTFCQAESSSRFIAAA